MRIFFVLFTALFSFISADNFDCLAEVKSVYSSGTGSIVKVGGVLYCVTSEHCVYNNKGEIYPLLKVYRHDDEQQTSITAGGGFCL